MTSISRTLFLLKSESDDCNVETRHGRKLLCESWSTTTSTAAVKQLNLLYSVSSVNWPVNVECHSLCLNITRKWLNPKEKERKRKKKMRIVKQGEKIKINADDAQECVHVGFKEKKKYCSWRDVSVSVRERERESKGRWKGDRGWRRHIEICIRVKWSARLCSGAAGESLFLVCWLLCTHSSEAYVCRLFQPPLDWIGQVKVKCVHHQQQKVTSWVVIG